MTMLNNWQVEHLVSENDMVMICKRCWCRVSVGDDEKHDEWHEQLRRAMDEGEILD
jgi:hypothetical protein